MYADILIFALIAAFLIYRLNAVLGTRHDGERQRPNPFAPPDEKQAGQAPAAVAAPLPVAARLEAMGELVDDAANADGAVAAGLADIAAADARFDARGFMRGARAAFEMIIKAYGAGDLETLRPLVTPRLLADFAAANAARKAAGHVSDVTLHRIKSARINAARLGGTMAYVTVAFDVEETSVTRDRDGKVVEGDPDRILGMVDVWTFARDTRSPDPNWMLIETRADGE
jgi:predicted lipid-binding transport protein (Tim44 family)